MIQAVEKRIISVIMPSFLGEYAGCAPNRKQLFIRAVNSFLSQTFRYNSELVIGSDGCLTTNLIVKKHYSKELAHKRIKLLELEKHPLFTGKLRQEIINNCAGEILVNLDTDDYFLNHHLENICKTFSTDNFDWVYFNNIVKPDNIPSVEYYQDAQPMLGKLSNANIAWQRELNVTWDGCDGVHDNQEFTAQLLTKYPKANKKIYGCGYVIGHVKLAGTMKK